MTDGYRVIVSCAHCKYRAYCLIWRNELFSGEHDGEFVQIFFAHMAEHCLYYEEVKKDEKL